MTMTLVSTVTVGSGGAASIDFTGIPQGATDLLLVLSARNTEAVDDSPFGMTFNGSTTGYTDKLLRGQWYNNMVYSSSNNGYFGRGITGDGATANTFGNLQVYIPNYSGSAYKSFSTDAVNENNGGYAYASSGLSIDAGLWSNTSAITSISLNTYGTGNFKQYSTASLYTITKGSGGATVS